MRGARPPHGTTSDRPSEIGTGTKEAVDVYGKAVLLFAARGDAAGRGYGPDEPCRWSNCSLRARRTPSLTSARPNGSFRPVAADPSRFASGRTRPGRSPKRARGFMRRRPHPSRARSTRSCPLDSAAEYDGWFEAAAAVLAVPHPVLAARCLGGLDAVTQLNGSSASNTRLNRRITAGLERSIGRYRLEVARASGRTRDRRALFDELAAAVWADARSDAARAAGPYGDLTPRERRSSICWRAVARISRSARN